MLVALSGLVFLALSHSGTCPAGGSSRTLRITTWKVWRWGRDLSDFKPQALSSPPPPWLKCPHFPFPRTYFSCPMKHSLLWYPP